MNRYFQQFCDVLFYLCDQFNDFDPSYIMVIWKDKVVCILGKKIDDKLLASLLSFWNGSNFWRLSKYAYINHEQRLNVIFFIIPQALECFVQKGHSAVEEGISKMKSKDGLWLSLVSPNLLKKPFQCSKLPKIKYTSCY